MGFSVRRRWLQPLIIFVSMFCVTPIFGLAGFISPLSTEVHAFAGVALYVVTSWGIALFFSRSISYLVTKLAPQFKFQND